MMIKTFMIFLLLQSVISFKFKERPEILKEECPVKLQDLQYDLIFFSKLQVVHKYKPKIDELDILQQNLANLLNIIREPNQKLLDIIKQSKIQENVLYVIDYEEIKSPDDLQAIQHYNILREFGKKYDSTSDRIFEGIFFLQFFEKDVNRFQHSINQSKKIIIDLSSYSIEDIQQELDQLQRDHFICKGIRFNMIQQSIEFDDKVFKTKNGKAQNKKSKHKNKSRYQKNPKAALSLIQWKYEDYEPVKFEECDKYFQEIEEDFLEFLMIQELVKYKRRWQEYKNVVHFLYQNKEEYIKYADIILKAKKTVKLNHQLLQGGSLKYYLRLGLANQFYGYNPDYKQANDAISSLDQTYIDLEDVLRLFDKSIEISMSIETFQFLKQKNEIINDYIDKQFSYQEEEVYKELLQINRDYKICNGKKKYEDNIFKLQKEIKVKQTDEKKEIILSPQIEKQYCEKQIPDIKENILYYLKLNVVKQFGLLINYYQQIMNDITEQQKNIINNNIQMNRWLEDLQLDNTLVFIQDILSNSKPDDVEAIKAYDNLNRLNNRLTSLKKYYQDAKSYLKLTDQDFQSLNEQFIKLKQQIDYSKYMDQDVQKVLLESLRDYNVCTQNDFIKQYNLEIKDRSQDDFSYSFYKDKNKFIKPINSLIQQDNSLLQMSYEWKYYDYAPIQKHECQQELPMIKEDILQFHKIQVLERYQRNNQKNYDALIEKVLNFKQDFLINAKRGKDIQKKFDFTRRLRLFNDYPKNAKQNSNPEILIVFDNIHEFVNKLGAFYQNQSSAIWLYNFEEQNFQVIKQAQLMLNDYLNNRFKYKMDEVGKELQQLYRDYQICTGKSYFDQGNPNKINQPFYENPRSAHGQPMTIHAGIQTTKHSQQQNNLSGHKLKHKKQSQEQKQMKRNKKFNKKI